MDSVFSWTLICYVFLFSTTFCRFHCTTKSYCTNSTAAATVLLKCADNGTVGIRKRVRKFVWKVDIKRFTQNLTHKSSSPLHPNTWVPHGCTISSNLFTYSIHTLLQAKTRFILLSVGKLYWNSYGQKWRCSLLPEMY